MKIVIIGAGRFGTYFGTKLLEAGHDVDAIDLDTDITEGVEVVKKADLTVFAVPISALDEALGVYASAVRENTLVIDVCTVKIWPSEIMAKAFKGRRVTVVGTHPLFGPQSAKVIQSNHRVATCPVLGHDTNDVVGNLFRQLGATVIPVTAEEHDRQQCQQMIDHLVGRAANRSGIARVELSTKTHELFMSIVDIVNGNSEQLFIDMNAYNPFACEMRAKFISALITLHSDLRIQESLVRPSSGSGELIERLSREYEITDVLRG